MKNMGLSELRLVFHNSIIPESFDTEKIMARAVHAFDIWENARVYNNLTEAVADCPVVIGTTRRRGHKRKSISMTPRTLAAWLADNPGPAAVVFGNERTGLEDHELQLCNFASHIPVCEAHPSLNLSHAVQLYAYEFFLALGNRNPVKGEWQAMNQKEISSVVESITDIFANLGFYKYPGRDIQERFFHDFISRAGLTEREGRYFIDIIKKAAKRNI